MLAAVYHGPNDLRLEQVEVPTIGPEEVLLKVQAAGICGTDLRIVHGGHRKYPAGTVRVPGHEVVGTIAQIGEGLTGFTHGQRVFVAPNMGCGHCWQCVSGNNNVCPDYQAIGITLDGAFAEYMRVPAAAVRQGCLMPIADHVDAAIATLIEPFACVLRGQKPLAIKPGETVLVIGAGPIGIMHLKLALLSGAGRVLVSEMNTDRIEQARAARVDRVISPNTENLEAAVKQETNGQGADVVIVAAPAHAAQEQALVLAGIGGRINFFGGLPKERPSINFDSNLVHYKELIVTATTACSTQDCRQAAKIINSGKIDLSSVVSQRFPLAQALDGFAAAQDRKSLKVVIEA